MYSILGFREIQFFIIRYSIPSSTYFLLVQKIVNFVTERMCA